MAQQRLFNSTKHQLKGGRRYWMHRLPPEAIRAVAMRKLIGSRSSRARKVKELSRGDAVLLVTTLLVPRDDNLPPRKRIAFVAAAQIEESSETPHSEVGYDKHRKKLKLRDFKAFAKPCFLENVATLGVEFLAGKQKLSDAMDFEYRQISEDDFHRIVASQTLVDGLPDYTGQTATQRRLKFSNQQLIKMFKLHRELLRTALPGRSEIEIKLFLEALAGLLEGAGIGGDYEAVYAEYRRLAHKMGFRHSPSRDPALQVELLDETGKSYQFAYVSLR